MAVKLEKVVPFGRSLDEYQRMFSLTKLDLERSIIGVGDGPASFNAEATKLGRKVISIDPIYQFSSEEIYQRFEQVVDNIIEQVRVTPNDWVWSYHQSPDDLKNNRVKAIKTFIGDYETGKIEGRYQLEALPKLSFKNNEYDLALCSHFLFLYSQHYDYQFHYNSILEMLRVSREVRIFPLLTLMLERSPYLERIINELSQKGYQVKIVRVSYELQKGGNEMLVIKK
jgi:hypothetical protein